ncbi:MULTISPECIES: hypothetical protein [Vibrio]|uniref:hypothetical protein n=1 Tax=Vibrio TaxID=662 RepID=UPI00096B7B34|nr:hypothetical protein [Vibrio cholerae]EGR1964749.1 hypothetical protein [Vibrio cholerae]EKF9070642.1 hypothetical protein [Vibrio cholerae]EMC7820538.1 hypothetical protein [Vibrio cholerae]MBO1383861.1 hypothetical protein [Vibrio cholerae]MDV2402084.1 hypothetical protein [Vibrio cholerae]
MAATIDTQYGTVTTSPPYFSQRLHRSVITLTLYPTDDSWGLSRECPAEITITPSFLSMFANDAVPLVKKLGAMHSTKKIGEQDVIER